MFLIVGLGNPGTEYEGTRHNIGFMILDSFAMGVPGTWSKKFLGLSKKGKYLDYSFVLLKPLTYMNHSGMSVEACASFYKIPLEKIIVLYDEMELPFLKFRIKRGGGHAGHNGLKDIDRCMGKDYLRCRFGVGRPSVEYSGDVSSYILSNFSSEQRTQIDEFSRHFWDQCENLFQGQYDKIMSYMSLIH